MPMTKQDYWNAGRAAAAAGKPPATGRREGTWQARAYNRGFANVPLEDAPPEQERRDGIDLSRMPSNTAGWPRGAAEHAYRLAEDINRSPTGKRQARLYRALARMQERYGPLSKSSADPARRDLFDVALSTQPCPEGPLTIRQVLRGL